MKKCSSCGKEFEEGAFCPECGGKLEEVNANVVENNASTNQAFCPNCGSKMNPGAVFCPNCGWSKTGKKNANAKPSMPKFNMPKASGPILLAVPAIVILAVLFIVIKTLFFGGVGKGETAIYNANNNTLLALSKNEIFDIFSKTFTKGSVNFELTKMPEISDLNIPIEGNGNFKMYFNKDKLAMTLDGKIAGSSCNDNLIYFDDTKAIAKVPSAFGEKIYGIDIKNLQDSWLMDLLKTTDQKTYNYINTMLDDKVEIDTENMKKDLVKIYLGLNKEFRNSLNKNIKFTNENDEISIGGTDVKVLKVSAKMSSEKTMKVISDILKWVKKDENVKKFIIKYSSSLTPALSSINYSYANADMSGSEVYDKIVDLIDNVLDSLENGNYDDDDTGDMQFYISKNTKQIVRLVLNDSESSQKYTFTCGPDWKDPDICSLKYNDTEYFSYTADKNGNDCTYNLKTNGFNLAKLNWDKKSGDFTLNINITTADTYKLTGNMKIGDTTTLELNKISGGTGWSVIDAKLNSIITLKKSDKFPSAPSKFVDILDMSQDEIQDIATDAIERLTDKYGDLGLFGSNSYATAATYDDYYYNY